MAKRGTTMLDEQAQRYASSPLRGEPPSRSDASRRVSSYPNAPSRHDYGDDFAGEYNEREASTQSRPRQRGLKLKLNTQLPKSIAGRIATGLALLVIAAAGIALLMLTRSFLLHDSRFMIQSRSAIEIQGNRHLTRAQLLTIFGEDVDRNIFRISLADRQAALEQLPWVAHATVMRLLPDRIRVAIAERTPVAFVRQGSHIGLVDGSGMLLDMAPSGTGASAEPHHSFPVVTGLVATDPASTRAARMRIYERFTTDLDSSGEKISQVLSEVDLSNPEDVKALIPANSSEILVHFGDDRFLERYRRFQEHLPAWHTQYPNLASVDMRYEREVVLDMAGPHGPRPDTASAPGIATAGAALKAVASSAKPSAASTSKAHEMAKPSAKIKPHSSPKTSARLPVKPVKPVAHLSSPPGKPAVPANAPTSASLTGGAPQQLAGTPSASAAARAGFPLRPAAAKPLSPGDSPHSQQVPAR